MSDEIGKGACIFWKNNKVHFLNPEEGNFAVTAIDPRVGKYLNCPCLDTAITSTNNPSRYGEFMERSTWGYSWRDIKKDKFPPEFKAALLLLDIQ